MYKAVGHFYFGPIPTSAQGSLLVILKDHLRCLGRTRSALCKAITLTCKLSQCLQYGTHWFDNLGNIMTCHPLPSGWKGAHQGQSIQCWLAARMSLLHTHGRNSPTCWRKDSFDTGANVLQMLSSGTLTRSHIGGKLEPQMGHNSPAPTPALRYPKGFMRLLGIGPICYIDLYVTGGRVGGEPVSQATVAFPIKAWLRKLA